MGTLRHLIVVVPGIGGSVLMDGDEVVWGDRLRRVVGLMTYPGRLSSEKPLHAVDVTRTLGFMAPLKVPGYDALVRGLLNGLGVGRLRCDVAVDGEGRDAGADIVLFPYDFRLGVERAADRLAAEVTARLAHLSPAERAGRVIVVGHSMGGLVARRWAADPDQASTCAAVVTVGTPHRGASKALDWLVNGVGIGGGPIAGLYGAPTTPRIPLGGATSLLRSWPSVYDLLPTYAVIEDMAQGGCLTPAELAGPSAPGFAADPGFAAEAARARGLHSDITTAWGHENRAGGPVVVPFLARDHGTPHAARLEGGHLVVSTTDPQWQPNAGWRGDGTVPALSAIPPELYRPEFSDRRHYAAERHVPMAGIAAVVQKVRDLVGDPSPVRGAPVGGLRLGVDLVDAALADDPVTVGVRLVGDDAAAGPAGMKVHVTVRPDDGSSDRIAVAVMPTEEGWQATFVPPRAGLWQVSVQAVAQGEDEPPTVTDSVAVVDLSAEVDDRLAPSAAEAR